MCGGTWYSGTNEQCRSGMEREEANVGVQEEERWSRQTARSERLSRYTPTLKPKPNLSMPLPSLPPTW